MTSPPRPDVSTDGTSESTEDSTSADYTSAATDESTSTGMQKGRSPMASPAPADSTEVRPHDVTQPEASNRRRPLTGSPAPNDSTEVHRNDATQPEAFDRRVSVNASVLTLPPRPLASSTFCYPPPSAARKSGRLEESTVDDTLSEDLNMVPSAEKPPETSTPVEEEPPKSTNQPFPSLSTIAGSDEPKSTANCDNPNRTLGVPSRSTDERSDDAKSTNSENPNRSFRIPSESTGTGSDNVFTPGIQHIPNLETTVEVTPDMSSPAVSAYTSRQGTPAIGEGTERQTV